MTAIIEEQKTTNQQSWADLLPEMSIPVPPREALITRSELFARLARSLAKSFSPIALADWERRGILPRAVVQSHEGKVQATYPAWWPEVVGFAWHVTHVWGYSRKAARDLVLLWISTAGRKGAFEPLETNLEAVRLAVNDLARGYRQQQMARSDEMKKARLIFVDAAGEEMFATEFTLDNDLCLERS